MESRHRPWRKILLMVLLLAPVVLSGCGLSWLYMRIGDSRRIKGLKVLGYATTEDRFDKAEKFYKMAIDNYKDAIMYDDAANPSVYHKMGFTLLLYRKLDLVGAENTFRDGLRVKRRLIDKAIAAGGGKRADSSSSGASGPKDKTADLDDKKPEKPKSASEAETRKKIQQRSDEEVALDLELEKEELIVKRDEDYALYHSGLGMVMFLRGIKERNDDLLQLAIKYFRVADRFSLHPKFVRKEGVVQKVLQWLDLDEISGPVPYKVLEARVWHYKARKLLERGLKVLAGSALTDAADALEMAKGYYPRDARYQTELASHHSLKKEYSKTLAVLGEIKENVGYSDVRASDLLRAQSLLRTGEAKNIAPAMEIADSLLDKHATDTQALLVKAHGYALRGSSDSANLAAVVEVVLKDKDNSDNPYVHDEIAQCFNGMRDHQRAKRHFLQAYQKDPKNVFFLYHLGNVYQALGESGNMKDCYLKLIQIEPSSEYAEEVKKFVQ